MLTINVNYVKELLKNNKHEIEDDGDGGEFCIHTFGEAFCPITEALNHIETLEADRDQRADAYNYLFDTSQQEIRELQEEIDYLTDSYYPKEGENY